MFDRYVGIDYSGASAPVSRLPGLQAYLATPASEATRVEPPVSGGHNWCRKELARWCLELLRGPERVILGIDHAFSFPASYLSRHELKSWDRFLDHFCALWPTERDHMYVDFVRREGPPGGANDEYRLCETWTAGAKSVFHFDVQGSVAKSTHAGLPWLRSLRRELAPGGRVHFWPFDGFDVPPGRSVVAETFPSLFRRRYPNDGRSPDQQDAYAIATWLKQMDGRGVLPAFLNPPLNLPERLRAAQEGWILGVF